MSALSGGADVNHAIGIEKIETSAARVAGIYGVMQLKQLTFDERLVAYERPKEKSYG